jgi:hypothetical protein
LIELKTKYKKQKKYIHFICIIIKKMAYKEKLQKRFEELDKKEHIDYRMIAFQL